MIVVGLNTVSYSNIVLVNVTHTLLIQHSKWSILLIDVIITCNVVNTVVCNMYICIVTATLDYYNDNFVIIEALALSITYLLPY